VLVILAKDPIISHFSGNECILYRKELFHGCYYHSVTTHKLVTLLIAN